MTVVTIVETGDDAVIVTADPAFTPVATTKIVSFTRLLSVASGLQVITGVGFLPRLIMFQNALIGGSLYASFGQASLDSQSSVEVIIGSISYPQPWAGIQRDATTGYGFYTVASFDPDGFTLTWTKGVSPTGTAQITATCFR